MARNNQSSLSGFFNPTGVVVIGASRSPTKLGFGLARNLVQSGFTGEIYFVNPKGGDLLERPIYKRVQDVPDPADLAVVLIPAPFVPQTLVECGERGIRSIILASGGFREVGAEGAALEDEVLRIARDYGMRLIGPNCIGIIDTHLPLDVTFLSPPGPTPGDVAFISHSGAICAAVIDWARGQGFGLSRLVSLGNQADVSETDVLAPVAEDPHTRVLALYLEGVRDGQRFVQEAGFVTRQKPVIALKVGRFDSGRRAVASHTGALAGQESAFNAAFRRAGVIRAETSEEMFDWARALAWCPLPKGRNVAVLTNSGGPGVTAADALEQYGLKLAELSPQTVAALREINHPAASLQNPVDMLASATPAQFARSLRNLLSDPNVDSVMVILPPPPMDSAGGVARAMIPIIYTASKPVVVAVMGERMIQEAVEFFRASHVPEYRFPERAACALATLVQRAEYLAKDPEEASLRKDVHPDQVNQALGRLEPDFSGFLPGEIALEILEAYGLRMPRRSALATKKSWPVYRTIFRKPRWMVCTCSGCSRVARK
jgi:acetyltransferase